MGIMTVKQYNRLREANAAGDTKLAEQIQNEAYGEDSTIVEIEAEEVQITVMSEEDIVDGVLSDISAGLDRKEIMEAYGISNQKISAIIKKAE